MKVLISFTITFLLISTFAFGQPEVYKNAGVLDAVRQLQTSDAIFSITKTEEVQRAVPQRRTSATDSLVINYRKSFLTTNQVRLDPEKVMEVFPEVVSFSSEGDKDIDYVSLIAVLFEAMGRQQATIDELKQKINLLEGSKQNQ